MSDNINIGGIQAGVAVTGGSGHIVGSGSLEVHNDLASSLTQLRALLGDLAGLAGQHSVSPQVQASVAAATAEADKATPDTGRLRKLMNAVRAGAGTAGPVMQAALNVINAITGIEKLVH